MRFRTTTLRKPLGRELNPFLYFAYRRVRHFPQLAAVGGVYKPDHRRRNESLTGDFGLTNDPLLANSLMSGTCAP